MPRVSIKYVSMERYLFRGKKHSGQWVEGDLVSNDGRPIIIPRSNKDQIMKQPNGAWHIDSLAYDVIPETVGQFTGLLDKHSNRIFEGDKVEFTFFAYHEYEVEETKVGEICFTGLAFSFLEYGEEEVFHHWLADLNFDSESDIEITGTIYDYE
jgi:hypothetical protein